jgi:hypothetical protein
MAKAVLLATKDLFFRSKLQAIVRAAGADVTRSEPCDLAVVELGGGQIEMIRQLVEKGIAVLAFGSHIEPADLQEARKLGARAVPNSEIESALRALLSA